MCIIFTICQNTKSALLQFKYSITFKTPAWYSKLQVRKNKGIIHKFHCGLQIVSVLTPIDFCHAWVIFGPLVDKNTLKGELVELPASDTWGLSFIIIRSLPLKSFLDFFLNVVPYQLESWFIHWVGCTTYWVHVSLDWDPCDLHVLSLGTVN